MFVTDKAPWLMVPITGALSAHRVRGHNWRITVNVTDSGTEVLKAVMAILLSRPRKLPRPHIPWPRRKPGPVAAGLFITNGSPHLVIDCETFVEAVEHDGNEISVRLLLRGDDANAFRAWGDEQARDAKGGDGV